MHKKTKAIKDYVISLSQIHIDVNMQIWQNSLDKTCGSLMTPLTPLCSHSLALRKEFRNAIVTIHYCCPSSALLLPQGMKCGNDPGILASQGLPGKEDVNSEDLWMMILIFMQYFMTGFKSIGVHKVLWDWSYELYFLNEKNEDKQTVWLHRVLGPRGPEWHLNPDFFLVSMLLCNMKSAPEHICSEHLFCLPGTKSETETE